jgi:hypothetical protein
MTSIDWPQLINLVVVAFLSGAFGASGAAWLTHHFTEKRDKAAWEREKEKLKEEFNQQIALYNMQSEDKKRELEQQALEQQRTSVRSSILKGIGDPRALSEIITFQNQMFRRGDGVLETRGSESDGVLGRMRRDDEFLLPVEPDDKSGEKPRDLAHRAREWIKLTRNRVVDAFKRLFGRPL